MPPEMGACETLGATCRADSPISRSITSTICRRGAAAASSGSWTRSAGRGPPTPGSPALEKESWVSSVLLEWGSCGKIVYVDGAPAGYALYAPPPYVPRSVAFPTSPVSGDAVLLMTAHVLTEFASGGLGRMLVQGMAKDLTRRGVKAIEAFGVHDWEPHSCMLPADYLLAVGFKTVRPHHHYPGCGWS